VDEIPVRQKDWIDMLAYLIVTGTTWVFLYPVLFFYKVVLAFTKAIFNFWLDFFDRVLVVVFPDLAHVNLKRNIEEKAHQIEQVTKGAVEPIVDTAKKAVVR
jgi:hypothetical protein